VQVPAPFEYERATSVEDALERLRRLGPEARIIAGGHSLLPMMKLRLATPEHLVDINDLKVLDYIDERDGEIRIGALTRHRELLESELLARRWAIFRDAEPTIADPVVRNRGTIGGALCQADPSEDLSAVCTALGAQAVIRGARGERVVGMEDFHRGPYETAVGDGEMLIEVRVPVRAHSGSAYEKVERRAGDWAIAAAGAALWLGDDGRIEGAGLGLAAVGAPGLTSRRAEAALAGQTPAEDLFAHVAQLASEDVQPVSDQRGPADYKRHLTKELTQRALRRAAERALLQEV
jgi:carbon-monoxide dehydrogenase medium subunit